MRKVLLVAMLLVLLVPAANATDFTHTVVSTTISDTSELVLTLGCEGGGTSCEWHDAAIEAYVKVRPRYNTWLTAGTPDVADWMDWLSMTQRDHVRYVTGVPSGDNYSFTFSGTWDMSQMESTIDVAYRLRLNGERSVEYYTTVSRPAYTPGQYVNSSVTCFPVPGQCLVVFNGDVGLYQVKIEYLTNSSGWQTMQIEGEDWGALTSPPAWGQQVTGVTDCSDVWLDIEGSTRISYKDVDGNIGGPFAGPSIIDMCGVGVP